MNKTLIGACVFALTLVRPACAAPGPALPIIGSPTGLSAGVFVPSSQEAKSAGTTQFDVEFRYGIPLPNPTPIVPVLGIGIETGNKSGNRSTVVPLTAGVLVGLNGVSPDTGGSVFAGGGVGIYFINQHRNASSTLGQLGTSTRQGYYVELGASLTKLVFIDARYQIVNRANGVTGTIGLRF